MLSKLLCQAYSLKSRRIRDLIVWLVKRVEGGDFLSLTLRDIFRIYHGVDIGMYTHGGCFRRGQFDRGTKIGRYCSIAATAWAFNRNHPIDSFSTHAYFFNPKLGRVEDDSISYQPLEIGHDVWIGHNAVILPNVRNIGTGAVVGAGAVVNKDVAAYSVVLGNPARAVKYRFLPATAARLIASEWWLATIDELLNGDDPVSLQQKLVAGEKDPASYAQETIVDTELD